MVDTDDKGTINVETKSGFHISLSGATIIGILMAVIPVLCTHCASGPDLGPKIDGIAKAQSDTNSKVDNMTRDIRGLQDDVTILKVEAVKNK